MTAAHIALAEWLAQHPPVTRRPTTADEDRANDQAESRAEARAWHRLHGDVDHGEAAARERSHERWLDRVGGSL